ncbi:hypothetical protein Glo7428_0466 [Gloeocapsa sp. PCC 7428]|uniref:hypothetical protein n=1 Tax=Gloeocapsa sp. PCC 7428 TaxID=1173026 RepID=UPI0002A5F9D1|nr:hypothetical protein [Gloeocapsa sp. PCC 7428]AFZ29067.1 hypothetical protein Glo7428_0466 [Gloeocapsa sp. PCC 7428]
MALSKFLLKLSIASLGILFIAAQVVPRFVLRNNEKLAGQEPKAVEYAQEVLWLIGHSRCSQLAALTCTGVRIVQLKPIKAISRSDKLLQDCPYPYEGKAIVYGMFGIPSQEIEFDCNLLEI